MPLHRFPGFAQLLQLRDFSNPSFRRIASVENTWYPFLERSNSKVGTLEEYGMNNPPTVMPQDMMSQPPHPHAHPAQMHAPVNSYYPENPNDLTGGLPINLDSLRDGPPGSKPFYPYSTLIRYVAVDESAY